MHESELINKENTNTYHEPTARTIALTMVLAFVLPVIIMVLALLKIQVWPGGKFTLLVYDLQAQFAPVISSLRYLGKGDSSLLLSFYGALGNNAFLNYLSYIIDPTIWITVLFPLEQLPSVIYFITLFKIGLCGAGVSAFFFFGIKEKRYPFVILILSVCYALMSYSIMYSQCILWFNVIALTPIIILGLESIIEGKKGAIYVLCMTLSLYSNGQLTYMIGIFTIMYLVYRLSETSENRVGIITRYVICNILCAGLYMPVALPVIFNIFGGRLSTGNPLTGKYFYYPIWNVIKQFLSCQYSTIESGGLPNLFCGTFIPVMALISLLLPVNPVKTRLIEALILVFFMTSFCTVPLNQFWHGLNEPYSYPARYSFLLCFYMLILSYQVVCYALERISLPKSGLFVLYAATMAFMCLEMYLNTGYILTSINLEMKYLINSEYQKQLKDTKTALNSIEDDDFYRTGKDLLFSYNDGMLFGYNGIAYFSSMFERNTMDFIGKLGFSQNEHVLTGVGGTPVSESILGIKYKILRKPDLFGYYDNMDCDGSYDLQYNKNALPLGFLMKYKKYDPDNEIEFTESVNNHNALVYQEYILSELRGRKTDAFEDIDYSLMEEDSEDYIRYVKIKFTATSDKPVWIYFKDEHDGYKITAQNQMESNGEYSPSGNGSDIADVTEDASSGGQSGNALLMVNGEPRFPFADRISTMCMYLGTFREGEEVEVEAACVNEFDDPWIAYYNAEECEAALQEIKETGLEITKHKNGVIKGWINIRDEDDLMVMTLPAMRGYRVKVDGVRTDYGAYRDALFALKIEPGEHFVEISFIPYGLVPGMIIGIVFFVITVIYMRILNDGMKDYRKQ